MSPGARKAPGRRGGAGSAAQPPAISRRALGRATLARQHLLERTTDPLPTVIERLVGLQAQEPMPPYTGLWSRVEGFAFADLAALLLDRSVARLLLMRSTVHLVTARDALGLHGPTQPPRDGEFRSVRAKHVGGVDLLEVDAVTLEALAEGPQTPAMLADRLHAHWPDHPREHLGQLPRLRQPLVQLPPRAIWGQSGAVRLALAQEWLGAPMQPYPLEEVVRRYLAGFGPATVKDVQAWSGLTRLKPVVEGLGDELVRFTGPEGELLFDLPDAERPHEETPAPVRILPEWDNLLIAHHDRTRVLAEEHRRAMAATTGCYGASALVDGRVAAHVKVSPGKRADDGGWVDVFPYAEIRPADAAALEAEGQRLLGAMGARYGGGEVVLHPPGSGFPGYERPKR